MYAHSSLVPQYKAALSKHKCAHHKIAVCAFVLLANGEMQLFPEGRFKATDGRPFENGSGWLMNAEIAARVIAKAQQKQNRVLVDYEHQTLYTDKSGQPAPASGWITPADIEYRQGQGVFAKVAWTAKAKDMIQNGEYLYGSPVFEYDPRTGEVLELLHVAITNDPALDGMAENRAAARKELSTQQTQQSSTQEDDNVKREQLIALLKLANDATDEQIQVALTKLQATATAHAALTKSLGVSEDASADTISTAVAALKAKTFDPAAHISLKSFEALKKEVAALKAGSAEGEVAVLVKQGLDSGKLLPVQKDWATALGTKDVAALKNYIETTPAVAALANQQSQGKERDLNAGGDITLTETELAVCKQMGISKTDYIAALKAEQAT